MSTDVKRLEHYLATAGARHSERSLSSDAVATSVFRREMYRTPDPTFEPPSLDSVADVADFVAELHASVEWTVRHSQILGAQTDVFRHLTARMIADGHPVAQQVIGECIAAYRLLFARDPNVLGLEHFVGLRNDGGLIPALRVLIGSDEARQHLSADEQPSIAEVSLAVSSTAIEIVNMVTTDTMLGVGVGLRSSIDVLSARVDAIAAVLQDFVTLTALRLDGNATR
ncbi:MAG: hypothetical protein JWM34_2326 [Ilumatobacteraceae bacterium]|nr:hypothetical protein [Ilumatobacteraceae bacterium]